MMVVGFLKRLKQLREPCPRCGCAVPIGSLKKISAAARRRLRPIPVADRPAPRPRAFWTHWHRFGTPLVACRGCLCGDPEHTKAKPPPESPAGQAFAAFRKRWQLRSSRHRVELRWELEPEVAALLKQLERR